MSLQLHCAFLDFSEVAVVPNFAFVIAAFHSPLFAHPLPQGHRFPMDKYRLLPEQIRREGLIEPGGWFTPRPATDAELFRVHDKDYVERLRTGRLTPAEMRQSGFPYDFALAEREVLLAGATRDAALFALEHRSCAFNLAGGTHHAGRARPEGFCLLNDLAVAAAEVVASGAARSILIVDLDVHQGNGTAEIFEGSDQVWTFSMHGARNFPLHKAQSTLDIGLEDGTPDEVYLALLDRALDGLFAAAVPDLVLYQAGVDVLATDALGRLGMTPEGCALRDRKVFEICAHHGVPVAVTMGGGYSPRLADILDAHTQTYREAQRIWG